MTIKKAKRFFNQDNTNFHSHSHRLIPHTKRTVTVKVRDISLNIGGDFNHNAARSVANYIVDEDDGNARVKMWCDYHSAATGYVP